MACHNTITPMIYALTPVIYTITPVTFHNASGMSQYHNIHGICHNTDIYHNANYILHSYSTTNKMHLLSQIIYSCKTLYMFRTVFPSIIRSSELRIQQRYM